MNKHLITFISILVLGLALIIGWKFARPILQERLQKGSSDASSTLATLHIGMDNWIGYFPLCSPAMTRNLRRAGYQLQCEDDQADYAARFARLEKEELQFAAATVDSYLLNGKNTNYPGTIIAVIDESKGGDAIVARASVFPTLDALKEIPQQKDKKIAFTPSSPSEHLLKGVSNHFGLPFFSDSSIKRKNWAMQTSGSEEALKKLRDRSVDAAVLWEPDVSRALSSKDFIKLIGTEDTDRLIVDILLVERHYSVNHPEAVQALIKAYFQTLDEYQMDPLALQRDLIKTTGLDKSQVNSMLQGVEWVPLQENNSLWFGHDKSAVQGSEGLIDAISYALKILKASKDIQSNPLPGNDPYRITNRQFVETLAGQAGSTPVDRANSRTFPRLDNNQWTKLKKIGTLKVDPIPFRRSTGMLDSSGRIVLDNAADKLRRYPNFRILVEGHTGTSGDAQANLELSATRARAVATYLLDRYNMDANRLHAVGYGGTRPLPRNQGESNRAYKYRMSRVDISLVTK